MKIIIKNCNNIDLGEVTLAENKLNIKYGANGTGKSTIAKAVELEVDDEKTLEELLPFKLKQGNPSGLQPNVSGIENIQSVRVFNEQYLTSFTFKPDELVANSFEIFIKSPSYLDKLRAIEGIISSIKIVFSENAVLETLLSDLRELAGSFKLTKTGISKASSFVKSFGSGNKLAHIPEGLESYAPFLRDLQNVAWIGWQQQGHSFLDIADECPFCTASTVEKKVQIKKVAEEYDKTTIKNLTAVIHAVEKLGQYFSEETRSKLESIVQMKDGLEKQHEDFLIDVKNQIDTLIGKLEMLKSLSAENFKETEKVAEKLPEYIIDLTYMEKLASAETRRIVDLLNASLAVVLNRAGELQGEINKQRAETKNLIVKNQDSINGFLKNAGYKYEVCIAGESGSQRLKLRHVDFEETLLGGSQHLSFGERNAFALVLFMYQCLSEKPGLIILDDPISSFDKDKKFAILEMLFRQDECLKGKTVMMLTHDVEPIIDAIKVLPRLFKGISIAHFLRASGGVLVEKEITKSDMLTFSQICKKVLGSTRNDLIKLIYLRRLFEVTDDRSDGYEVLSNLFKRRQQLEDHRLPKDPISNNWALMTQPSIDNGTEAILSEFSSFEYASLLARIANSEALKADYSESANGYEKLQIYRLIDNRHKNSVIRKYINGSYHVENDFICQLDPTKFDPIPQYIIDECDAAILDAAIVHEDGALPGGHN